MTVLDHIIRHARSIPGNAALNDGKNLITYGGLFDLIRGYGNYFTENVCRPGNAVVLKLKNKQDWVIAFLSLLASGCWVVPVSDGMSRHELDEVIKTTGAAAVVDESSFSRELTGIGNDKFMGINSKSCGILHMTSGSTGKAKFCIRTIEALTAEGCGYIDALNISAEDRILALPPLYHSYALGAACITSLVAGACIRTADRFVPREVLRILEDERITVLIIVPVMASLLCNTYTTRKINPGSLRIALAGAGAITEEMYTGFLRKFGIALQSNYGSTETGGIITRLEPVPWQSIGRPMRGVEVKILDEEGKRVTFNEEGELWVKCGGMLSGYHGIREKVTDHEGFFPMSDIVSMDEQGYLYIRGRKKLIINVGGKKVNPIEVERVLQEIPGVDECAVIGISKPNGGEAVKAVVAGSGLTEDIIRRHCSSKLMDYKIPSIIEFRDKLPRNELGKVKLEDLTGG